VSKTVAYQTELYLPRHLGMSTMGHQMQDSILLDEDVEREDGLLDTTNVDNGFRLTLEVLLGSLELLLKDDKIIVNG
jgi:hypothetical protein